MEVSMPLFQAQVYPQQAPGVEGDFCDHNPRATVDAGPGGLVAASEGVTVARFGWLDASIIDPNNAPTLVHTRAIGGVIAPAGFVHREQQGLITSYLGGVSMLVPGGFPITLHQAGGFFVLNRGTTYAQYGMKAFARLSDGAVVFGATGTAPGAATVTSSVAASTFSATGSIAGNVLTVSAVGAGSVVPGSTISGTNVVTGTRILGQLSGATPGGVGTYAVSIAEQTVASTAIAGTYGTMTVTVAGATPIEVGDALSGGTVVAGTSITAMGPNYGLTGTGGLGTYAVDNNTVVASASLGATDAIETKWFATSAGAAGEIIKMSSWPLG
jgi:hypothetical protein